MGEQFKLRGNRMGFFSDEDLKNALKPKPSSCFHLIAVSYIGLDPFLEHSSLSNLQSSNSQSTKWRILSIPRTSGSSSQTSNSLSGRTSSSNRSTPKTPSWTPPPDPRGWSPHR